ncbi:MAG TPA: SIMPL domain-containing protein [Aestuariivirgaceae bacterium]|nr:SIMPL domain-containing protein [Aestuariivirgaceae bacterium]
MLKTVLAPLILAACLAGGVPALAQAPDKPPRTLTLTGTGEMRARPDTAVVTLGVMSRADTARQALTANNAAMTAILASLEGAGIAAKDIQTSNFSVNPVYDYDNSGGKPPRITGYDVSNQLVVTVRKLADLGSILDEAVSKGSNQIYGISFTIDDPDSLEDEARKSAVQDATRKAKLYAEAAGVTLDSILSISEQVTRPPQPVYMKAQRMEAAADASVPVAEGEQSVSIDVAMTWTIR